ncbi:hypothetical protein [Maritimibacter sp. UBA3975]|uniref:hypothetical protein n=1 Tax=Maritimibacter sp. UBA3975 TaxID=1946833 RepID=UPI000C0B4A77|nr:hypothetical protein [Maritimibacter sp. UBA3975]MAM60390.1 hypothetical protein [Maritimibacter sp.]|tara:strand:- start:8410 stop:8784 length:375 start_codon:yes stop_codon:yes gene_type:complete
MTAKTALRIGLTLWTLAFIVSFVDFGLTEPSGDGFTAGLNKVAKFVVWQGVAAVIAVALWVVGGQFEKRSAQRVASRIPGIVLIAILLAFGLLVMSSRFFSGVVGGDAPPPQTPTTVAPEADTQ